MEEEELQVKPAFKEIFLIRVYVLFLDCHHSESQGLHANNLIQLITFQGHTFKCCNWVTFYPWRINMELWGPSLWT